MLYSELMSDLTQALIEEIQSAPEPMRREVFDFLVFLKVAADGSRRTNKQRREVFDFLVFLKGRRAAEKEGREDLLPLAQSAWAPDWNTPEEDEASAILTMGCHPPPGADLYPQLIGWTPSPPWVKLAG